MMNQQNKTEIDEYLWLENIDGQNSLDWVEQQNERTEAHFAQNSLMQKLLSENEAILNSKAKLAYPLQKGGYIYNFWQDGEHERGLWRRTTVTGFASPDPKWEIILDIDQLSEDESTKWVFKGAEFLEPDCERCIVYLSRGGADATVIREFDCKRKMFVADGFTIPESKGGVCWLNGNSLLVSSDFGAGSLTDSGYPRIVKRWTRGTNLSDAVTLFEGESKDVAVGAYTIWTGERNYCFIYRSPEFFQSMIYELRGDKLFQLDIPLKSEFSILNDYLIVLLKEDWQPAKISFSQGCLLANNYSKFISGNRDFEILYSPNDRSSVEAFATTKNHVLINCQKNVTGELLELTPGLNGWTSRRIEGPELGSINIQSTDPHTDICYFSYTSFLHPTALYCYESGLTTPPQLIKTQPSFFDTSDLVAEQFEALTSDKIQIPYFLVHKKSMKLDGKNPTLLYGYGGFGVSLTPVYSPILGKDWLELGGVYVLANIRGGGEFGPRWHEAAKLENRQIAFDDFYAVGNDLITRQITDTKHLGIEGGSNGGLLVGVALTQHPELFSAVVCQAPLLDMSRFNKLLAGASWMGEYGDPDNPKDWTFIKKYSPYQNLNPKQEYPAVLFTGSTRDDRVHPGHARKMAAKMLANHGSVYFYENTEGGHAGSSTLKQLNKMTTLTYVFLWENLK